MKKKSNRAYKDDLLPEYDFRSLRVVARGPGRKAPKQSSPKPRSDGGTMRPESDFSKGVRGKHAVRYAQGTNVVVIDPEVLDVFPNGAAVNQALRALAPVLRQQRRVAGKRRSA